MRVYTHSDCLNHQPGSGHPECPARLMAVTQSLKQQLPELDWYSAPLAERHQIERAHHRDLVAKIFEAEANQAFRIDADTMMSEGSLHASLRSSGALIAAIDAVMRGDITQAFCAIRPPGHHATFNEAMGFCLFNHVAVGAMHLIAEHQLSRIAVIDFDVHHGNGTQDIFKNETRVFYLSSHQDRLYPNSGFPSEDKTNQLANRLLSAGSGSAVFRDVWQSELLPQLDAYQPEFMLISAGFDAHHLDPLADLNLQAEDYFWLSAELAKIAKKHSQNRIVSTLEGGYSLTALRECSVAHLRGLMMA
jgi:acetoin utilization deacetylase AcuC-like enzyme